MRIKRLCLPDTTASDSMSDPEGKTVTDLLVVRNCKNAAAPLFAPAPRLRAIHRKLPEKRRRPQNRTEERRAGRLLPFPRTKARGAFPSSGCEYKIVVKTSRGKLTAKSDNHSAVAPPTPSSSERRKKHPNRAATNSPQSSSKPETPPPWTAVGKRLQRGCPSPREFFQGLPQTPRARPRSREKQQGAQKQKRRPRRLCEPKGHTSPVDFAKKLLGQIVFLHFLQRKGWLGVALEKESGASGPSRLPPRAAFKPPATAKTVLRKNPAAPLLRPPCARTARTPIL